MAANPFTNDPLATSQRSVVDPRSARNNIESTQQVQSALQHQGDLLARKGEAEAKMQHEANLEQARMIDNSLNRLGDRWHQMGRDKRLMAWKDARAEQERKWREQDQDIAASEELLRATLDNYTDTKYGDVMEAQRAADEERALNYVIHQFAANKINQIAGPELQAAEKELRAAQKGVGIPQTEIDKTGGAFGGTHSGSDNPFQQAKAAEKARLQQQGFDPRGDDDEESDAGIGLRRVFGRINGAVESFQSLKPLNLEQIQDPASVVQSMDFSKGLGGFTDAIGRTTTGDGNALVHNTLSDFLTTYGSDELPKSPQEGGKHLPIPHSLGAVNYLEKMDAALDDQLNPDPEEEGANFLNPVQRKGAETIQNRIRQSIMNWHKTQGKAVNTYRTFQSLRGSSGENENSPVQDDTLLALMKGDEDACNRIIQKRNQLQERRKNIDFNAWEQRRYNTRGKALRQYNQSLQQIRASIRNGDHAGAQIAYNEYAKNFDNEVAKRFEITDSTTFPVQNSQTVPLLQSSGPSMPKQPQQPQQPIQGFGQEGDLTS